MFLNRGGTSSYHNWNSVADTDGFYPLIFTGIDSVFVGRGYRSHFCHSSNREPHSNLLCYSSSQQPDARCSFWAEFDCYI